MQRIRMILKHLTSIFFVMAFLLFCVNSIASNLNMTQGVTLISHEIYNLHMLIFWICVAIGASVFSVMIYAMINHRKSKGVVPATFHENTKIEIIWTVIPFLILMGMAVPATKVLMKMNDSGTADVNIKVTGYQWKWRYDYLDEGIHFFSNLSTPQDQIHNKAPKGKWYLLEVDKPLVVPVHKKIRLLITSNDVNHSWWVPDLGIKMDAIPGYIHEAWTRIDKPGTYRGQCAELCGMNHGYMPIVVIAKTDADYQSWVKAQRGDKKPGTLANAAPAAKKTWNKQTLMAEGKKVYLGHCAVCHQANGTGMPPAFPALKGSKVVTGPLSKHIDIVLNGVSGKAMQAFREQLSDEEIAAVITYQRNSWGNKPRSAKESVVMPRQVKAAR